MAAAFAAAVFILIRLLGRTAPGQGVYRERNRLSRNEILGFIAVLLLLGLIAAAVVVWLRHSGHSARRLPLPIFPSGLRPGSQAFPLAPPRAPARLPAPRLDFSSPLLFLVLAQAALVSAFRLVMKSGRTMKVRAGVGALAGRPIEGLPEAAVLAGGGDIAVLYRRICRRLTVVVPYGEELTPREYVGRLLAAGIALPEIERLTTLFELERYRGARRAGRESPSKGEASRLAAAIERRLDAGEGARGGAVDG